MAGGRLPAAARTAPGPRKASRLVLTGRVLGREGAPYIVPPGEAGRGGPDGGTPSGSDPYWSYAVCRTSRMQLLDPKGLGTHASAVGSSAHSPSMRTRYS